LLQRICLGPGVCFCIGSARTGAPMRLERQPLRALVVMQVALSWGGHSYSKCSKISLVKDNLCSSRYVRRYITHISQTVPKIWRSSRCYGCCRIWHNEEIHCSKSECGCIADNVCIVEGNGIDAVIRQLFWSLGGGITGKCFG